MQNCATVRIRAQHIDGGKRGRSVDLQRLLYTNETDVLAVAGSHRARTHVEAVESVNTAGTRRVSVRHGAMTGTFRARPIDAPDYPDALGSSIVPTSHVIAELRPYQPNRVRLTIVTH